jgi:GT2 family glycosyltransferase
MISIIVSSYKKEQFNLLCKNIEQSIGNAKYEIIRIHNPGLMGICKAYNIGARRAQFPYLIFAHEDILFYTPNWGEILIKTFESCSEIGLIGVAGSKYKAWLYSGWSSLDAENNVNYIRSSDAYVTNAEQIVLDSYYDNIYLDPKHEAVVAIDGLFMATTREIYKDCIFDEKFNNFHCYDLDYSFQVLKHNKKVIVTSNLSISHLSFGSFNSNWFDNTILFHEKWYSDLPRHTYSSLSKRSIARYEKNAFRFLLPIFRQNKYGFSFIFKQIYSWKFVSIIGLNGWLNFQFFLFYYFLIIIWRRILIK